MIINGFDTSKKVLVIAEIGNNHEGSFDTAVKMVEEAAETGADAVKFQTFKTELFINKSSKERFEKLKSFELTFDQFDQLSRIAKDKGLIFISTPFDLESAVFLKNIVDAFKIPSSDNTFYPLIDIIAASGKPIIASTGLASLDELKLLNSRIKQDFALLHCVTSYPVPNEEVNLSYIWNLKQIFDCAIGYSDHSLGIQIPAFAVAAGARIVEKHFTLDKNFSDFRDHQLSADPDDMKKLVLEIRMVEAALGDGADIQRCESGLIGVLRRSIAASRDIPEGSVLKEKDIVWLRGEGSYAPGDEECIIGHKLKKDVLMHEILTPGHIE